MRTTGVRSVPNPTPRPSLLPPTSPKQSPHPPKPLPRTKFLQKAELEEAPATSTSQFISNSLPPSSPPKPVRPKYIITRPPPPKPPRSPNTGGILALDAAHKPRHPGLMQVLSRPTPATAATPAPGARLQCLPIVRPARPVPLGSGSSTKVMPARRAPRPRLQPLSLPPPSTSVPPKVPSRPTSSQLAATRISAAVSVHRPSPPSAIGLQSASNVQSPVCSPEDFESSCRDVFRNARAAKELTGRGKHVQAASHYQKALTALDRVLRTQVLSLTQHEPTRQRLFLMQQEVFNIRKEALNGFADAQAAVRTPRGLSPVTTATPRAPPSYDDVLKEDSRRLRDDPPRPSRQTSTQQPSSSPKHPPPADRSSQPHSQPASTRRASTRTRCLSSGDTRVEELVNVKDNTGEPSTCPPVVPLRPCFKPTLISATRPKSSYHPLTQLHPPLSLPPTANSHFSLPPPLLPVSIPPASLPSQHSGVTSMKPHLTPSPDSVVLDEAVLSQMKAIQKYEGDKCVAELADTPTLHPQEGKLPPDKDNTQERKEDKGNNQEKNEKDRVANEGKDVPQTTSENAVQVKDKSKESPMVSLSTVDDPFLRLDPFPSIKPQPEDNTVLPPDETQDARTSPAASDTRHTNTQVFPSDSIHGASLNTDQRDSLSPKVMQKDLVSSLIAQSPPDHFGDSILEALDVAVTPVAGHKKVSPRHSRDGRTARSYSEENLLDASYNTFETLLHPSRDRHASRASIIEEFDPLLTSHALQADKHEEEVQEDVFEAKEGDAGKEDKKESVSSAPPKPAPRRTRQSNCVSEENMTAPERGIYESPPDYYVEGGAAALPKNQEEHAGDRYTTATSFGAHYMSGGIRERTPYSSESSSNMYSFPPDYFGRVSSSPSTPVFPTIYPEEEEEEEEEDEVGVDVGRSAFYLPPTSQENSRRRSLLSIHEGVKIFFIHTDGIVTSPWKKPLLSVSRDASKDRLFGTGMMLSVGNSLWVCELNKKATLVLKTHTEYYVFNEVAGKPECKAVAIKVPSGVRRAQQELLSNILQHNTLLEEERPKGITKAISKGASSAALRMNKLVEEQSMTPTQPFVRRNSIRAIKGVSKRLSSIAEKTGSTLKELPEEYQSLQEAADTLAFARTAKMIQYI